jgi:hypothetical protein
LRVKVADRGSGNPTPLGDFSPFIEETAKWPFWRRTKGKRTTKTVSCAKDPLIAAVEAAEGF